MSNDPIDALIPLLVQPPDLSSLNDGRSWNLVEAHAARYGVAPLIAYVVRLHVSGPRRVWCDRVLVESWGRYERMLGHLQYVFGLFADAGIPAISLKGPLLAQRYYQPPFLRRPSGDLDIAVAECDLERATALLVKAGYTPDTSIAEALARSHHAIFSHSSRPRIELHFRLSHMTLGIPVEQFFDRAVVSRLPNGIEVKVLGPADQLLHLMLHLATARFGTLFHLYEVRRAFQAESAEVRAEAFHRTIEYHFAGVLRMVDIAFRVRFGEPLIPPGTPIPETWLNRRLNEKLYRQFEFWSLPDSELTLGARLWGRWLDFQITDTASDAMRALRLLIQSARFGIANRAWGKIGSLTYGQGLQPR